MTLAQQFIFCPSAQTRPGTVSSSSRRWMICLGRPNRLMQKTKKEEVDARPTEKRTPAMIEPRLQP
jgi:hypothetical protein